MQRSIPPVSLYPANNIATLPHQRSVRFPVGVDLTGYEMAIESLCCTNSWYNLTPASSQFSYKFFDGTVVPVQLPLGETNITNINAVLQATMLANGHAYVPASATSNLPNIYFLSITFFQGLYRVVIEADTVQSTIPSGYKHATSTTASPAWTEPSTPTTAAQITIPVVQQNASLYTVPSNQNQGKPSLSALLGVPSGVYPPTPQTGTYQYAGTTAPSDLVSCVLVVCDKANNSLSTVGGLLYSFQPTAGFGYVEKCDPQSLGWCACVPGITTTLTLSLLDQNGSPLGLQNPNVHIRLQFRKRRE